MKRGLYALLVAAIATVGFAPTPAAGQAPASTDELPGWLAWFGCWGSSGEPGIGGETICVLPGDDARSARFVTIEDGGVAQETTIHADGVSRPVQEGGCEGHQTAFLSSDGHRIFTRSDLSCSNAPRVTTGVLGFVGPDRWVDSQALTVRDQHAARSVVYEAVGLAGIPEEVIAALPGSLRLAQEAIRLDASAPMDIDAVIEANSNLAAPALDGFLAAGDHGFALDAAKLQRLSREGVPASTIDVMVAISYPERFAVRDRQDLEEGATPERVAMRDAFYRDYCYDPFWVGRYGDCFNSFGYGSSRYGRYGYSPFGYDPYGWQYSRSPVFVVVEPETGTGGGTVDRTRGYVPSGAATGSAAPRSGGATPAPSAAPQPSSAPASSGTPSGGGYAPSRGGGGDSGSTRTAVPRDSNE